MILSIINAIISAACTVGLIVSVIITVANEGRTLLSTCTYTNLQFIKISHECPFDPTRIYVSNRIQLYTNVMLPDCSTMGYSLWNYGALWTLYFILQSTTLCLWVISILLDTAEMVFSMRCYFTVLQLMDVHLCHKTRKKVSELILRIISFISKKKKKKTAGRSCEPCTRQPPTATVFRHVQSVWINNKSYVYCLWIFLCIHTS